jgi:hypothetical protein
MLQSMEADSLRWRVAFEPLWNRLKEDKNEDDLFLAALMKNRVVAANLGCIVITLASEDDLDHFLKEFEIMVAMSEYMLGILDAGRKKAKDWKHPKPEFNFDSYTVIPMFLTALKCRDPIVRRKAISLLLKYPRREGVCDSVCMGKLCEWAMMIEEEHIEDGRVPGWARIHGVTLARDLEGGDGGTLMCEQRISASSNEVVLKSARIAWNFSNFSTDTTNVQVEHLMGCKYQGTI